MVDNVTADPGTGGAVFATDEISAVHYPIMKMAFGALDSVTLASSGAGNSDAGTQRVVLATDQASVTVDNAGTFQVQATLDAETTKVIGTVNISAAQTIAVTNAGTFAVQSTQAGTWAMSGVDAENAAVSANPVLSGGRYDLTPRILGDGDAGAIAVDVNGHTITSPHAASIALADDVANTANVQVDETGAFMVNASFGYMFDGTTWDRIRGDATNGLLVNLGSNNDITGTVTANAGTNLNTSALALESGGNLDTLVAGQLPDGHNVTVDNAAGASAVNIQDGGNSITIDGSVGVDAGTNLIGKVGIDQVTANANEVVTKTGSLVQLEAGTAGIGKLTANSGVDIGDVDVTSAPARVATTDNIGAAIQTNQMMDGTTSLTPKYVAIDAAASGNNTLLAAVSAKKIRVLQVILVAAGDVVARFEDGAGGTALSGQMTLTTNSGFEASFCPVGHFETTANTLLNLELSAAISVDGWLVYVEV